ncbi:lcat-prov protein, putative [Trichomonas vaginalis G3]|uniref:Lcat-prov protein, putative n=1 Tax=Trichomonas vaginalis (strain ATCC PRA-98 / G3) TaxID=412133 RepID=A2FDZ5_TRIV3|nr:lcat-prov protein, putative [Trichomonas vaginalis G3]|eukprot:XP_001309804.1 lcat-prov protein [Trichomonas vaginalis G3]
MKDELIWVDATMFISKRRDCLCKLLTPRLDSDGKIRNYKNISIYVKDFGGEESLRYVANFKVIDYPFVESMASIIDYYKKHGYEIKKDLFLVPYDFRISPAFSSEFHEDLKSLIENASKLNNQKVTLFGFSLGDFNSQYFLQNKVDQAWKDKYIDQLILLAPSFVGMTSNLLSFWTKSSSLVPNYHAPELQELCESWPSIHVHNPNLYAFGNRTVFI